MFRTNHFDENQVSCVVKGGVQVFTPQTYSEAEGDDVFYCEYKYDPAWQRFQRWYVPFPTLRVSPFLLPLFDERSYLNRNRAKEGQL